VSELKDSPKFCVSHRPSQKVGKQKIAQKDEQNRIKSRICKFMLPVAFLDFGDKKEKEVEEIADGGHKSYH
jgi:hypothetical protein